MNSIIHSPDLNIFLCFLVACGTSFFLIPSVVEISRKKHLVDVPGARTSHEGSTPTLGGIGIFIGYIISCLIFLDSSSFGEFQYIFAGALIIFFIGFKDDLVGIDASDKLIGQVVAALLIIILGNVRFTSFHGFLGIYGISNLTSITVTMITIVGISNCFNLMDGIDGLSGSMGVIASAVFGLWFYHIGEYSWAILAFGLIGSLLAFLYFNLFARRNKIFMGDTGSLLLGFLMAIMAIRFNESVLIQPAGVRFSAAPAVSIGVLIIPIFDTLRVAITRIYNRVSPFTPDKIHIHHYLLELTHSHMISTAILIGVSLLFCLVSYLLRDTSVLLLLLVLGFLGVIFTIFPIYLVRKREKQSSSGL